MVIWLAAAALAAAPGGFRVDAGVPVQTVGLRQVLIANPGDPWTAQTVLRGQGVVKRFGFDVQLPVVATWEPGWADGGAGQLRLGARYWLGRRAEQPVALGLEAAFPTVPREWRVSAWGSASRETLPAVEMMVVLEATWNPDVPITLRLGLGFQNGPFFNSGFFELLPAAELALVAVQPVSERLAVVGEAEVAVDLTPVSLRALTRWDPIPGLSADLGVQLPVVEYVTQPVSIQLIGQVRAFF